VIGQSILNAREIRNEVSLTMQLGDDFFTGTIDHMQKDQQGSWQIIDYKTNRISGSQLEQAGKEYEIQIQSYALLLSHLYPGQKSYRVSLYFLAVDKLYEQEFSLKEVQNIKTRFTKIIDEIKRKYPVNSSSLNF